MASISKYALRFQNRVLAFEEDIELVDILCNAQKKHKLLPADGKLFEFIDSQKHTALGARKVTDASQRIVVTHLRSTVYASYIKDIYEELTAYLKSLLYEAAVLSKEENKAKRLLGEHKVSFSAAEILQYRDLDELIIKISEEIIQALENERSTKELISKICKKIDLPIETKKINDALPYLELRHKFVHADGKIDSKFKSSYPMFKYDADDYIKLNAQVIYNAKKYISELVLAIDAVAVEKGILKPNTP